MTEERPCYGDVLWAAMWQYGFIIVPEPDKGWAGLSPGDANDYDMVADAVAAAVLADVRALLEDRLSDVRLTHDTLFADDPVSGAYFCGRIAGLGDALALLDQECPSEAQEGAATR